MPQAAIPAWVRANVGVLFKLHRAANLTRGKLGCPIWLCGSFLRKKNPRDVDIRVNLPDSDFKRMFGDPKKWETEGDRGTWTDLRWKWSDECVKMSRWWFEHTGLNIDFQIYPESYGKKHYGHLRRCRLDTRGTRWNPFIN
jgi:hypothetical protein